MMTFEEEKSVKLDDVVNRADLNRSASPAK